jgi:hypothetical protein
MENQQDLTMSLVKSNLEGERIQTSISLEDAIPKELCSRS